MNNLSFKTFHVRYLLFNFNLLNLLIQLQKMKKRVFKEERKSYHWLSHCWLVDEILFS